MLPVDQKSINKTLSIPAGGNHVPQGVRPVSAGQDEDEGSLPGDHLRPPAVLRRVNLPHDERK